MNKSSALLLAPLVLLQVLLAAGTPIRYDQRQDGDSNVDARLSNFFVVLAPSNTAQLSNTGVSLLDLASKAVPLRLRPQAAADGLKQREEVDQPDQEVKEVKSGRAVQPLAAVAIPAAILQSPLAKLHPEVQALAVEEVLIARSPVVALKTPPGPTPVGAPAVPMLVAIPVPEVAPERPSAPPALLPMHPQGDKPAPAAPSSDAAPEAAAAAIVVPEQAAAAPESVAAVASEINAVPEAASLSDAIAAAEAVVAAADEVAAPAPAVAEVLAAAAEAAVPVENAPPAVETNQVEPEIVKKVELPKIHLIGTGIEECGPERIRNQEGVCVDEPKQD